MTAGSSTEFGSGGKPHEAGEHARALSEILAERIRRSGPITFADFMRESLYHPVHGYYSRGGAQGVGRATTYAVVSASVLILVSNYIITEAFFAR